MKKFFLGQASLEMVFTYGWMILVVVIVTFLLYNLGIFSSLGNVSAKQNQAVGLATFEVSARVEPDGAASFRILNNGGGSVVINTLKINGAYVSNPFPALPFPLSQGEYFDLSASTNLNGSTGSTFSSIKVEMTFSTDNYASHVDNGVISGVYAPPS